MTGVYYKIGGVWTQTTRPYLKIANVWTPVNEVWTKRSGTWQRSYLFDITPPDIPEVSLEIVDTTYLDASFSGPGTEKTGRHIKIGVRTPGGAPVTDLRRIRVLTTYNGKPPTTQYGGTYTSASDDNWPSEPWSDWQFNGFSGSNPNKDSSVYHYKTWPRSADATSQLNGDSIYYFTAWSEDFSGNWSAANAAQIYVPKKGVDGSNVVLKEARFDPNSSGSVTSAGFTSGDLIQQASPYSRGFWFYGNQFGGNIGAQGPATIKSAQIQVNRRDDTGQSEANVYLFWHPYNAPGDLPGSPTRNEATKLGTIAKGESKWFPIPDAMIPNLISGNLKGFGLDNKNPVFASAQITDYSVVRSVSDSVRCGEVHVTWTEKLG